MNWLAKRLKYATGEDENRVTMHNGAIWSVNFCCYICFCQGCKREFFTMRPHSQTCSPACRKRKSRKAAQVGSVTLPEKVW